jgi:hypothetical protein
MKQHKKNISILRALLITKKRFNESLLPICHTQLFQYPSWPGEDAAELAFTSLNVVVSRVASAVPPELLTSNR